MKVRRVPDAISKRFRRKLKRSSAPYLLWLRCKRPHVYARLTRLWQYQWLERITSITPWDTPFFSTLPKVRSPHIYHEWLTDTLKPMAWYQPYLDFLWCQWYYLKRRVRAWLTK